MVGQIRITPQELRDGATYLEQRKGECMESLGQMKSKVDEVTGNWEGAAQNSFVQTFEELYKQISDALPQTVEGIESMLNGAAQAMEEADDSIAQAFNG
ncbi:WXG100 family type VII secretion target [Thermophilibacter sp.]